MTLEGCVARPSGDGGVVAGRDAVRTEALRRPLLHLCATYLTSASGRKGFANSVARFHLSNGARSNG